MQRFVVMKETRIIPSRYAGWVFWASFWLLNFALFLPVFLFFRADAAFWPLDFSSSANWQAVAQALFWQRDNPDIFRLNLEFTLLVSLWVFLRGLRRRWVFWLALLLYGLQLIYAVYEGFVRSYYLLEPVLFNDLTLFANGTGYVLEMMNLSPAVYLRGLVGLAAGAALLGGLHWLLLRGVDPAALGRGSKGVLLAVALWAVGVVGLNRVDASGLATAVSSFSVKLAHNATLSQAAYADARRFDGRYLAPFYQFTANQLAHKPNIHILFIESYGSVLYQRPDFQLHYGRLLWQLERELDRQNWHVASNRSQAPTWGGGSWIAYTSFLTGLQLDSHAQFLQLFQRYQEPDEHLPHLFNYLQTQGYGRYFLTSNANEISDQEWQQYKHFYGADEWLRFSDLAYSGPLYGWGPSPPDQYVLHYGHERITQSSQAPYVVFFITQNSHYPWYPLPKLASDWRALNDLPPLEKPVNQPIPQAKLRMHYLASIEYALQMVVNFILQEGGEDDLFVLVGDHQPARVARYADGWDTPIHVISRDADFVRAFHEYGFVPGLATDTVEANMHHAGFYSLLMRVLVEQYGLDQDNLPIYRPEGIQ